MDNSNNLKPNLEKGLETKMISFENIKTLYENPDILLEASEHVNEGKNIAVDVSARTRVIHLHDARIHYKEGELYIPGDSYVLTYKQAEKTVKSRTKVFHRGRNIFPKIVDTLFEGKDPQRLYQSAESMDVEQFNQWMRAKGKKEINYFIQISNARKNKEGGIDKDGLILLEGIDPITPLQHGYELNGVFHAYDRTGRLDPPLEISAYEAEIGFASTNHTKITDSEGKIGKFHEGILTLRNPTFIVHEILREKDSKNSENLIQSFYNGALIGGVLGLAGGIALTLRGRLYFGAGIALTAAFAGGVANAYRNYQKKKSYPSETNLMRVAFYGTVKDKRFDNLEDMLE